MWAVVSLVWLVEWGRVENTNIVDEHVDADTWDSPKGVVEVGGSAGVGSCAGEGTGGIFGADSVVSNVAVV
jgi:hypothetical protein